MGASACEDEGHQMRHRWIGAAVELADRIERLRRFGPDPSPDRALVRPGRILRDGVDRMRRRVHARLVRWETIGREEEAEARILARIGVRQTTNRVLQWLSDQPALRQMVAEQSVDLSRTALDEARDAARDADARAESFVGRLLRPRRRTSSVMSPSPAE